MATVHFRDAELACSEGCGLLPPQAFQDALEALRIAWGRPLVVTSGARCPEHNQRVSTTGPHGPHTRGAVDLRVAPEDVWDFVLLAMKLGWTGIGLMQKGPPGGRFVHLDRLPSGPGCPRSRIWTY